MKDCCSDKQFTFWSIFSYGVISMASLFFVFSGAFCIVMLYSLSFYFVVCKACCSYVYCFVREYVYFV